MLIKLDHIGYRYRESTIFSDISLSLKKGEVLTLYGPSGSGKTTLLQILGKLIEPTTGKAIFDRVLDDRQKSFGYAFIDGPFFEKMTVEENVLFLESYSNLHIDKDYYRYLMEYFEMLPYTQKIIRELSVGQRERVGIIRAFVHHPKVVILDEPGSSLDDVLFQRLMVFFTDIKKQKNTTLCIATHSQTYSKISDMSLHLTLS